MARCALPGETMVGSSPYMLIFRSALQQSCHHQPWMIPQQASQVGDSKLFYSFPLSSPYYFNMVVSNGRVPVRSVAAEFNGVTVELTRT